MERAARKWNCAAALKTDRCRVERAAFEIQRAAGEEGRLLCDAHGSARLNVERARSAARPQLFWIESFADGKPAVDRPN